MITYDNVILSSIRLFQRLIASSSSRLAVMNSGCPEIILVTGLALDCRFARSFLSFEVGKSCR